MKITYTPKDFREATLRIIVQANRIIEDYQAQGFKLTLRQLYYQFVSRDLVANKQSEYKRLGSIISDARRAGLIDWDSIEDRTRNLRSVQTWDNPQQIIDAVGYGYKLNPWDNQDVYVEVWFEKDALMGVFERPTNRLRIPYFSCRGYTSDSEIQSAATRLARIDKVGGQRPVVLHFGDHDPSGMDMTRDIGDRLTLFGRPFGLRRLEVRRLALNMEQIEQYDPPPNPAKETDARFANYQQEFGDESWELDALEPTVLAKLVEDEVADLIDQEQWDAVMDQEREERAVLRAVGEHWDDVKKYLDQEFGIEGEEDEEDDEKEE